jgi:hypothetical protein
VAQLVTQLQQKETELDKLQLVAREFEGVSEALPRSLKNIEKLMAFKNQSALYSELDQLALQWESLDKQVKNKVFNLHSMEEKLIKSVAEVLLLSDFTCRPLPVFRKPKPILSTSRLSRHIRPRRGKGNLCNGQWNYRPSSSVRWRVIRQSFTSRS